MRRSGDETNLESEDAWLPDEALAIVDAAMQLSQVQGRRFTLSLAVLCLCRFLPGTGTLVLLRRQALNPKS